MLKHENKCHSYSRVVFLKLETIFGIFVKWVSPKLTQNRKIKTQPETDPQRNKSLPNPNSDTSRAGRLAFGNCGTQSF